MKRTIKILFGIIAVLIGLSLVMPALAQWRQEDDMKGLSVALFLLGVLLTVAGGGPIHSVTKRGA